MKGCQTATQAVLRSKGICGLDEAGRGPLAGPVCAAAVVLKADCPIGYLADSKQLSPIQRQKALKVIIQSAVAWGVGWASHIEIDKLNILRASLLAMERAYKAMAYEADLALVDGLQLPALIIPCIALTKADSWLAPVMAASIIAKTARDRIMECYGRIYPEWGYERHKGYPTAEHRRCLARYGPSPIQRRSFRFKSYQGELF